MGVGMPTDLYLHEFGSQVWAAFGKPCYHVGSSLEKKTGWRDVDVRMILDDETWDQMELGAPAHCHENGKWVALCMAFSCLGTKMTGLPIDFQLQRQTEANKEFDSPRSALGFTPLRMARYETD